MKLNKRIAALELNMSLSSEYLSELSKQYIGECSWSGETHLLEEHLEKREKRDDFEVTRMNGRTIIQENHMKGDSEKMERYFFKWKKDDRKLKKNDEEQ